MDAEFWRARWQEGKIGFHEGRPNRMLERYVALLSGAKRVLVPLCGKAEDLAYLAHAGHEVVGVELVESAVRGFFEEHGLVPVVRDAGAHRLYESGPYRLVAGDFFTAPLELLGPLDGLYDRAALIALPEPMRRSYVAALRRLLPEGAPGLVVTIDYDVSRMDGPPFAVSEAHVRELYQGLEVRVLEVEAGVDARLAALDGVELASVVRF
ncbi:MAG: thiopurine S-methyltransferase [Deltaproteobacteria bacterium]|nr:thiopurine S-methyltransferase [Deltaproteobacteria bacterium]